MHTTEMLFKARVPLGAKPPCNKGGHQGDETMAGVGQALEGSAAALLSSHYP